MQKKNVTIQKARDMQKLFLCALLLVVSNAVAARSIDLNYHSDALRATYAFGMQRNVEGDVGILILDKQGNKNNDSEVGLHTGINFVSGSVKLGGRLFYISPGNNDLLALGFGGQGRIGLSKEVGISGHFYYAPEMTSMLDAASYHDLTVNLDLRIAKAAFLYLGYRNLKVKIGDVNNKLEIDDDFMVGFKIHF